ncbi:MAG: hypothetical protein K6G03_12330, partial [Lachnospiraceae bacterium]|nr:hypothetical protein [Lachnospiraceae bacterium]
MKSVVLDIKSEKAAIIDDTGVVHAVANKDYAVGQVLYMTEVEIKKAEEELRTVSAYGKKSSGSLFSLKHMSRYTKIVAAAMAVIIIGGGATAYAAPVSTVTVEDSTGSVEYKLNVFDRVVGVEASDNADEDFKADVSELSHQVHGMKITEALDVTAQKMESRSVDTGEDTDSDSEITVKVEGLKKGNKNFNDSVDHKVMEIRERRINERLEAIPQDGNAADAPASDTAEEMDGNMPEKPSIEKTVPETQNISEPDENMTKPEGIGEGGKGGKEGAEPGNAGVLNDGGAKPVNNATDNAGSNDAGSNSTGNHPGNTTDNNVGGQPANIAGMPGEAGTNRAVDNGGNIGTGT